MVSSNPSSSFQDSARIAAIVEHCQDYNQIFDQREIDAVWEIHEVEAPDIGKTHGVTERVGQKQLIAGLDSKDKPLPQPRSPGLVPVGRFGDIGLNSLQLFERVHLP